MPDLADLFPGYASEWINTSSGRIFARVGGKGPPLLLLHGFSSTHVMWHPVAPQLADKFTLIIADLPGYGWSDMPRQRRQPHALHQARDGEGDGRGDGATRPCAFRARRPRPRRRVSYRLALDHPGRLSKLAVLDILPTYDYWERLNRLSALKIYHWAFLAQPYPLPETLISGNGISSSSRRWRARPRAKTLDAIDPRALEHYLAPFRDPSRVHAMCEDYRAGAYADYEIDKADLDAGKKITIPMLALWGDAGVASAAATPLDTWKKWATNVQGRAGGLRAFSDGGESGCDGEVVAGVFSGRCSRITSSYPRKRVSSTPRPLELITSCLWNTGSSAFADDDSGCDEAAPPTASP